VLRILTVFGAIFLPLTFITGVFGMNVLYPGEGTHTAFWVIVGLMIATIAGMIAFFKYKRWL
jgi:magnesium transporter